MKTCNVCGRVFADDPAYEAHLYGFAECQSFNDAQLRENLALKFRGWRSVTGERDWYWESGT